MSAKVESTFSAKRLILWFCTLGGELPMGSKKLRNYLNAGMGIACAGHNKANLEPIGL